VVADATRSSPFRRHVDRPGACGLMLVDLAKHVAAAYEAKGIGRDAALRSIRAAIDAEWSHPTDVA
jgi:hypothetical protein